MKIKPLLRHLAFCSLLLACAGWVFWSIGHELWMSLAVSLAAFMMVCVAMYYKSLSPLRALHNYILNKYPTGGRELLPRSPYSDIYDTECLLDKLMDDYRAQTFEEAGRQQFYELVLRQVETGVVACTKEGRVEWMNRCAEEQLGLLRQVAPEWLDETVTESERVVLLERHGHRRECLLTRMAFSEGEEAKLLFTLRDIRHVLEVKQQESWKSLSRVLTHEIMNSMTPILSLADTLATRANADGEADAATILHLQQGLEVIRRRGKGLMDFVNNYRLLTRVPPPQPESIDADGFFADLRKLFPMSYVDFEQSYRGFSFRADRAQLEQVLINLIKNALEAATSPDSPVSVGLSRSVERKEVHIHVQDHGQGIASAELEHIFMPFYTTKPGGSGIGLSLCRQIVNNHGGDIQVHSVANRGSCFTVCLPY